MADIMKKVKVTRKNTAIWLVGSTEENFKASKLPSRGEVLRVLFHYHDRKEISLKDSISKTSLLLLAIWEKAKIPTKAPGHIVEHIRKLHAEWQGLKKLINRTSDKNLSNQNFFQESLDDLFDVAHRDAMTLIKINEDRQFLKAQREKGRRGTMGGVDRTLSNQEERVLKRRTAAVNRALKAKSTIDANSAVAVLDDSTSDSNSDNVLFSHAEATSSPIVLKKQRLRGTVPLVTREVASALDRTNTSDRKAAHILSAMASSSYKNVEELIISRSAIRRARIKHRAAIASEIKAAFDPTVPLILHWDGKIMDDFTSPGRERVDRLPILVSGQEVVKLLSVPKLSAGKAITVAQEVLVTVDEWGLQDRIKGLCFDTTASNTGIKGGVCVLIESEIDRDLLNLACRHHISEIMLEKVFSLHEVSKSPNVEIFLHFRNFWRQVDQTAFSTAMADENTAATIATWKDSVINFARAQMLEFQPRDDYLELLELTIIFLGGIPAHGIHFRYPGAVHRARWMARAIYSIKIWLFRNQFFLQQCRAGTPRERFYNQRVSNHLKQVALFVTSVYVRYWFQSPSSIGAPRNDLALLRSLSVYPEKEVSKAANSAISRHLWYLSEVLVGFSFFDDDVPAEEKRAMVLALKEKDGSMKPKKRIPPFLQPETKALHDFVTKTTLRFFKILGLPEDFLEHDPEEWRSHEAYQKSQEIARSVKVVNDLAERGVSLIQEFNSSITRKEDQKQFLLQVVEVHRKAFPAPTKTATIKSSNPQ